MTLTTPPPALHASRRRTVSIWIGAIVTSACVAGGAMVTLSVQDPVEKPADVAAAYLEARYDGDWSKAWALECSLTRSFVGDYTGFVERAAYWDESLSLPRHVEVAVGSVHAADELSRPAGAVATVTVTSAERRDWSITGELPLVVEEGQFRVCTGGLALDSDLSS